MRIMHSAVKNVHMFYRKGIAKSKAIIMGVVKDITLLSLADVETILVPNIQITFDYILLIAAACIVSTLGLLMNSTPVIVGGMIISPLMWPIVGTSYGLWQTNSGFLWKSMRLLGISIIFTLFTSALLTFLSPIKVLNPEILGRTAPTLFDLVVALASGSVAMLALTNKRVSSSIAGVAIATALLPPICVSGIGIALFSFTVFWGGLLLFFANAVAIVTVGIVYLTVVSLIQNKKLPKINIRGTIIFLVLLGALIIPLKKTLSQYGWKLGSLQTSKTIVLTQLHALDPSITLASIQVSDQQNGLQHSTLVDMDIVVPQGFVITLDTKEQIRQKLVDALHQQVDLNIRVQQSLSILSANEEKNQAQKSLLTSTLKDALLKIHQEIVIDSITINKGQKWYVEATLTVDPSNPLTEKDREVLETTLSQKIHDAVSLALDLVPRIKLNSDQDEKRNSIQKKIGDMLALQFPHADLLAVSLGSDTTQSSTPSALLMVQVRMPQGDYTAKALAQAIRKSMVDIIEPQFTLHLRIIPVEDTIFTK